MQSDLRSRATAGIAWAVAALLTFLIFALAFSWILVLPSAHWSLVWGGHGFRRAPEGEQHPIPREFLDQTLNETLGVGGVNF